jgi:hypothetical protein
MTSMFLVQKNKQILQMGTRLKGRDPIEAKSDQSNPILS